MVHLSHRIILTLLVTSASSASAFITPAVSFASSPASATKKQSKGLNAHPNNCDTNTKNLYAAVIATMASAITACSFVPNAIAAGDVAKGETLFKENCAACHVGGMNVIKEKRTLKKDALEKFVGGANEENVKKFVTGSMRHQTMVFPRIPGGHPTDENFDDVVSYIVDQATGDKW
mmetsp:Transcript_951/g.1323  ORF Transcript_951/g.1323 Transcript_951/m.1323 type:complete len:176 (+) Transcript_951:49-576(+)